MTTEEKLRVKDAVSWYQQEVADCEGRLRVAATEAGVYLRHLLAPVLHRWGMGMKKGGALLYPEPSVHRIAQGIWEVEMDKECDYALGLVHPELSDALWSQVDIFPYEDTFHDYVDDIPLPTNKKYLWILLPHEPGSGWSKPHTITFSDSVYDSLVPGYSLYYGPITKEYLEDVSRHVDLHEFINTLPCYIVNRECQWELHSKGVKT